MKNIDDVITGVRICRGLEKDKSCRDCPYAEYDEEGFETAIHCEDLFVDALFYLCNYRSIEQHENVG